MPVDLAKYQAGYAPLLVGIAIAVVLTCFLRETGPSGQRTPDRGDMAAGNVK
jgi:hypothetical protein